MMPIVEKEYIIELGSNNMKYETIELLLTKLFFILEVHI